MKLRIETAPYDARKYKTPWIAIVSLGESGYSFTLGTWKGDAGNRGELCIDADEGDVVAIGQEYAKGYSHEQPLYFIVLRTGELDSVSKNAALIHIHKRGPRCEKTIPICGCE